MKVKIYTDGSCKGNPGPGGWAIIVNTPTKCKKYSGGELVTTNNRMELTAVIECLKRILWVKDNRIQFEIHSDSAYVINGITKGWIENWKKSQWKTSKGEPVKNAELWEQLSTLLDAVQDAHKDITFVKIRGHAGNTFNELCDKLAKEAADKAMVDAVEGKSNA